MEKKPKKKVKNNSDRGNRTPGCRVRDGDVNHYTISDWLRCLTVRPIRLIVEYPYFYLFYKVK